MSHSIKNGLNIFLKSFLLVKTRIGKGKGVTEECINNAENADLYRLLNINLETRQKFAFLSGRYVGTNLLFFIISALINRGKKVLR